MTCGKVGQVGCSVALFVMASGVLAQEADSLPRNEEREQVRPVDQHDLTIKQAYKDYFLIGMAGDLPGRYTEEELALVREHFDIATPENCMKPGPIHPGQDVWRFERSDALVQWCVANDIAIHGHTLVWHAQTNDWFFRDGDKAAVTQRMKDHISTLVGRYKGKIRSWDVVNEAINDGGNARTAQTENLRNSSWLRALGPEFLTLAFKFAHEADPDAKLYYNDYGIEAGPKHASSMVLLQRLINDGAPIHGVGIQGHWSTGRIPFDALDKAISDYAALGLEVSVTELDVTIRGESGGQFGSGFGGRGFGGNRRGGGSPPSPEDLKAQADDYARLFAIFIKHQEAIERVTFWGLNDRRTWRAGQYPLIFDATNQRKPAYQAIIDARVAAAPAEEHPAVVAPKGLDVVPAATKYWTADNGNGTYSNPLFYEEFEDPDVIRVDDQYYLAGTTMHMNPAVQLMRSKDLVNWELAGYCMDRLDLGPAFRLERGNIYGQGIWAPCIRHHQGMFYVFSNVNSAGLQVFRSQSIEGPWERNQLPGRHDLSVLFDDDGKIYIISGNHSPYPIEELSADLRSFVPDAPKRSLNERMGEGHHLYKINGRYVDVSAIPGGAVDQLVAVADSIDGPWTVTRMVEGESLGVTGAAPDLASADDRGLWLHQGGIVDTPSGQWWSIIMSDHGSAGRMVSLVPVTWDSGFPLIGLPGNLRKAPNTWLKPDTGHVQEPKSAFIHDDRFDGGKLNPHWQWNHVPDDSKWSVTEKPGVLRLYSLPASDFYTARNSLCQRPPGPESIMTVEMDTSGMVAGDTAGLALLSSPYAWIGVVKSTEGTSLQMYSSPGRGRRGGQRRTDPAPPNEPVVSSSAAPERLWLRVHCNFDNDQAVFFWSADGHAFTPLGPSFTMTFQLTTFQGVRPALFHYNALGQPGGYVDFDNYSVDEPRASGIERAIPHGKTIVLTSGADGSVLAADLTASTLVNLSAGDDTPAGAKLQVIDLGLGRVALKASDGRVVSVAGPESVVLKALGDAAPSDAETFQWINLLRGDTMLMSLTNHRYLATKPHTPGPVTVTATGPSPARKGGACFRWEEVAASTAD